MKVTEELIEETHRMTLESIRNRVLKKLKIGDSIMVYDTIVCMKIPYVVEAFYSNHVLFRDIDYGLTSSFQYIDILAAMNGQKLLDGRTRAGSQRYDTLQLEQV